MGPQYWMIEEKMENEMETGILWGFNYNDIMGFRAQGLRGLKVSKFGVSGF